MQQSIVDQVVFGRDVDFSGETQWDEEFIRLFRDSAGRGTWELPLPAGSQLPNKGKVVGAAGPSSARVRTEGRRVFQNSPTLVSNVDRVVFGQDEWGYIATATDKEQPIEDGLEALQFDGSAGRPSAASRPVGLRTYHAMGGPLADAVQAGNAWVLRRGTAAREQRLGGRSGRAAAFGATGRSPR